MTGEKNKFDLPLEGLRGLACLLVLHMHLSPVGVDPASPFPTWFFTQFSIGKQAVLIFFLISGYVIGLTNRKPYSRPLARDYLRKRVVRLVPLCWMAVFLSVLAWPVDRASAVVGNLFFLQNWHRYLFIYVPVLQANPNLWSLNYEVLYYLSFLCIWFCKPSERQLAGLIIVLAAVGVLGWFLITQARSLTGYAVGGVFWYSGLWLAWYGKPIETAPGKPARIPWISIALLFFSLEHVNALYQLLAHFGWVWTLHNHLLYLSMLDFQSLPLSLIVLAAATGRQVPLRSGLWAAAWSRPLLFVVACVATSSFALMSHYELQIALLFFAAVLWPLRHTNRWLIALAPVGFISYGLYIFGRPAEEFVTRRLLAGYSGTDLSYPVRVALTLVLAFALAYLGERILQPQIRRLLERFFPRRTAPSPVVSFPLPASTPSP